MLPRKKLQDLEAERVLKEENNAEKEKLVKQVKSLQDDLNESQAKKFTAFVSKGKDMDKRNIKHSKQVYDFEQIVIVERRRFGKERDEYKKEILELSKKVSDFQNIVVNERKELSEEKKEVDLEKIF